jgi:hypothetical protein
MPTQLFFLGIKTKKTLNERLFQCGTTKLPFVSDNIIIVHIQDNKKHMLINCWLLKLKKEGVNFR